MTDPVFLYLFGAWKADVLCMLEVGHIFLRFPLLHADFSFLKRLL